MSGAPRGVWIEGRWGGKGHHPFGSGAWFVTLLIRWAINAIALIIAAAVVPGIELRGWESALITAAIFGLINAFIRPLVLCLTCLLQILTLGLFTLVVNAGMLALTAWLAGPLGLNFEVEDVWAALLGALVITVVSFVLTRSAPSS